MKSLWIKEHEDSIQVRKAFDSYLSNIPTLQFRFVRKVLPLGGSHSALARRHDSISLIACAGSKISSTSLLFVNLNSSAIPAVSGSQFTFIANFEGSLSSASSPHGEDEESHDMEGEALIENLMVGVHIHRLKNVEEEGAQSRGEVETEVTDLTPVTDVVDPNEEDEEEDVGMKVNEPGIVVEH